MKLDLGRPDLLNQWLPKMAYFGAAIVVVLNMHFSAAVINERAIANGAQVETAFEAAISAWAPAVLCTLYCILVVGLGTNAEVIPGILNYLDEVCNRTHSSIAKIFARLVGVGFFALIIYVLITCYRYDLDTTQRFFGNQVYPLFSIEQLPTWLFIIGPELLVVCAHTYQLVYRVKKSNQKANRAQYQNQQAVNQSQQQQMAQGQQTVYRTVNPKQTQQASTPWGNL